MQVANRNKRRERDRFRSNRDLVPGLTWPHDLIPKSLQLFGIMSPLMWSHDPGPKSLQLFGIMRWALKLTAAAARP
jgi:hypothetical protein